jgi:cell volume regulation protein A
VISDVEPFGLVLLVASVVVSAALLSNRISARLRIPAPVLFLVVAAVASDLIPALGGLAIGAVEQIATVALVVILFDGGMHIGAHKLRAALGAVVTVGVLGTFLTAGVLAALAHLWFGFEWPLALLLGTALAPTDPAVVFSVLGNQEIAGRTGTIIEGESGANDPVGIALLVSLLGASAAGGWHQVGAVFGQFLLQMLIGGLVGVVGGALLVAAMRHLAMPSEGLYPLRTLAFAFGLYGVATVAHGSGFLAVFLAGILVGDVAAPFKREIERFHSSLSSLAEIIVFVVLGLTVSVRGLVSSNAWVIGLALAALLVFVVRPLLVGPLLLATRLRTGERLFVLWAGMKGAVPILLGTYVLAQGSPKGAQVYGVIVVVVAFSVLVQGGLVPTVARWCGVRMERVEPLPWSLGVRLRDQPAGARRYRVAPGAAADGCSVRELHLGSDIWISLIVRDGRAVPVRADTELAARDEVLVLADPAAQQEVEARFTLPSRT